MYGKIKKINIKYRDVLINWIIIYFFYYLIIILFNFNSFIYNIFIKKLNKLFLNRHCQLLTPVTIID